MLLMRYYISSTAEVGVCLISFIDSYIYFLLTISTAHFLLHGVVLFFVYTECSGVITWVVEKYAFAYT